MNLFLPLLLVMFGCTHSSPLVFDELLVQDFSPTLQKKEPVQGPFLSRFTRDGYDLHYLASDHENQVGTQTFLLVDYAFQNMLPGSVILEGFQNNLGPSPTSMVNYWTSTSDGKFYKGGEGAYAGLMAVQRDVRFIGGEPAERDVATAVWSEGYSPHDLLGFYVVRQVPQWKRDGSLKNFTVESLFRELMRDYEDRLQLTDVPSFERFKRWYREKNGRAFDPAQIDAAEAAPIPGGSYFTQKVSCLVEVVRNRFILRTIGEELNTHRRVLVIYGRGHLPVHRAALEKALGPGQVEAP